MPDEPRLDLRPDGSFVPRGDWGLPKTYWEEYPLPGDTCVLHEWVETVGGRWVCMKCGRIEALPGDET